MTKVRVACFSMSLDGYAAGPDQSMKDPLGVGGARLAEWFYPTRTFQSYVLGNEGGTTGIDEDFAARGIQNIGAWILGRNMFSPSRGPWSDDSWKGWWGEEPSYDCPVYVLTRHPRADIKMGNNTTFHFVTSGIHDALERARAAAGDKDIRIGGGANTIRQYLRAGLVDEMHVVVAPVLLGQGEPLFEDLNLPALGYECVEHAPSEAATHVVLRRSAGPHS